MMSAGTGVTHSEFNLESEDTNIFQIWIEPDQQEVKPRWDSCTFPKEPTEDSLKLLVSGDGEAPLSIHQDAYIYAGNLIKGTVLTHPIKHQVYVLVSEGSLELEGHLLKKGDGLEVTELSLVNMKALTDARVLVIDVPH